MIAIELDNRVLESNKYEYAMTPLIGLASNYISIPLSIILDDEIDIRRAAALSYLRCRCGIDGVVGFTIPSLVKWCGNKPDKRTNGINSKFLNVVDALNDRGYLTYLDEPSRTSYMECEFDLDYFYQECTGGFAIIYLDEIKKIMNYKKENAKDSFLTNSTLLLVFAYLRAKIYRRPNELRPEQRNAAAIEKRKRELPEAYEDSLVKIYEEIGISQKTFSKAIDVLEEDLGLIVTDKAYRTKNKKGEFRTPHTIFANAYKREGKYLLASGEKYSRSEIERKAEKMKEYYGDYEINRDKRKVKKGDGNI